MGRAAGKKVISNPLLGCHHTRWDTEVGDQQDAARMSIASSRSGDPNCPSLVNQPNPHRPGRPLEQSTPAPHVRAPRYVSGGMFAHLASAGYRPCRGHDGHSLKSRVGSCTNSRICYYTCSGDSTRANKNAHSCGWRAAEQRRPSWDKWVKGNFLHRHWFWGSDLATGLLKVSEAESESGVGAVT